jgi:GH25 family lysozyme M1 (1,4-beta-N-acetylmuramidase)
MPRLDGIDISNHQGKRARDRSVQPSEVVQWAHDAGLRGIWFKATEGTTYQDPYFRAWRRQASQLGFEFRGMYHWLTPGVSVERQLANFVDQVGNLEEGESIQLDCEQAGLSAAVVMEAYGRWTATYGDRVLVYMGWYYGGGLARRLPENVPWWLPWYGTPKGLNREPVIWQWGGGAEGAYVPLLDARVDANQINDDVALRRLSGYPDRPHGGIPEEDDLPYSEAQLRQMIREEAWTAVIGVLRSPEVRAIIHDAATTEVNGPAPSP